LYHFHDEAIGSSGGPVIVLTCSEGVPSLLWLFLLRDSERRTHSTMREPIPLNGLRPPRGSVEQCGNPMPGSLGTGDSPCDCLRSLDGGNVLPAVCCCSRETALPSKPKSAFLWPLDGDLAVLKDNNFIPSRNFNSLFTFPFLVLLHFFK